MHYNGRASDQMVKLDSRPGRYQVTILGKLFTPMCLCHQAV